MIIKKYPAGDFNANSYLVIDEMSKEAALIDCAGNFEGISKDIEENGAQLKYILLTHGHFDHIVSCSEFAQKYQNHGVKIMLHKADEPLIDNIDTQCKYFGLDPVQKPQISDFIDEKSQLNIGNKKIQVISTPGHSKGSLCFFIDNTLFSGDTLFYEEIGRCDLPGGDFEEIKQSITQKLFGFSDDTPVLPGHGIESTIGHEKEFNCYFGKNSRYV